MSLLDDALRLPPVPKKDTDTDDEVRLAVAWFNGVVTDSQAASVLGITAQGIASRLGRILRRVIASGRVAPVEGR